MATEYGRQPGYAGQAPGGAQRGRLAAVAAVIIGLAGIGLCLVQVVGQMLPRHFTSVQRQQIMAWEVGARWRELPAGTIFPASAGYLPPQVLRDTGPLALTARRAGIAPQSACAKAADAAASAVLDRDGCQAMLRATYSDGTGSFLVTIGVAAFPSAAQAAAAQRGLSALAGTRAGKADAPPPGVDAASFAGTLAAGFTDSRRQLSGSVQKESYVVLYTIGYADNRPWVPVASDAYADSEMTSMGAGLARLVAGRLAAPPPAPHCPGTPGC